jgi:hypothetical protein
VLLALSRELGLALGLGLVVVETRVLELGMLRLMLEHLVTRTPPVTPIVRRSLGLLLVVGLRIVLVAAGVVVGALVVGDGLFVLVLARVSLVALGLGFFGLLPLLGRAGLSGLLRGGLALCCRLCYGNRPLSGDIDGSVVVVLVPGVAVLGLVVVSVGGGFVVAHRLVDLVRIVGRTLLHAGILAVGQLGLGLVVGRRGLFGQVGLDRLRGLGHVVDAARVLLVVHVTPSRFQFGRSETEVP